MQSLSREVTSSQRWLHPRLAQSVQKHRDSEWLEPRRQVDEAALRTLDKALSFSNRSLILDSFCGTGMSTSLLAKHYPDSLVVGVDKSLHRLNRAADLPENALLLRANCEAVWRFLSERRQVLRAHYLLYPNPWPKPGHFGRRIHGHPAFTFLPQLGGYLELRSNWQVYVEEFGVALGLYGHTACVATVQSEYVSTLFEQKYRASGQTLWCLKAMLSG